MSMQLYRKNQQTKNVLFWIALIAFFVFILFPFYWIITMSFKSYTDIISWPPKIVFQPTMENYRAVTVGPDLAEDPGSAIQALRPDFPKYFSNTLIIACFAVLITLAVGCPAAYALSRFRFRGREELAFTFLSFRFAPELVIILPVYIIFQRLRLINTFTGLILVYQLITLPLTIWIMRGYFGEIPVDVEEAALIDGCSRWTIFTRISLPLVRPGLAATAILAFIFAWNSFVFGLVLAGRDTQPVTIGLLGFIGYEQVLWGQMAAGTVIAILPQVVLASLVLRHIVRGLTFGAVKG